MIVALRAVKEEFAAAVHVRVPPAEPLAGETVSQVALLKAVHAPAGVRVRVKVPVSPEAFAVAPVAEKVADSPACVTVKVALPTVMAALRELKVGFAAAVHVSVPPV